MELPHNEICLPNDIRNFKIYKYLSRDFKFYKEAMFDNTEVIYDKREDGIYTVIN